MAASATALVVEDERSWSEVYQRAARRVGLGQVEVADSYDRAAIAIDARRFAVAIIDVGLAVDDDRNVDGLRVMERIRAAGDPTSLIVVTGRTGRDVVLIVRDAIKRFNACDVMAKSTLVPAELRRVIEGGVSEYRRSLDGDKKRLYAALRGKTDSLIWDNAILRGTSLGGNVAELYRVVECLLGDFVPLLPGEDGELRVLDGVACGAFWSRGAGAPVVACVGAAKSVDDAAETAAESGLLLGRYRIGEIIGSYGAAAAKGTVYRLADRDRSDFN